MFRDAAQIDGEQTAAKIREIESNWEKSADTWFDGSVESIDKRLAQCNRLIGQCRAATVRLIQRPEATRYMRLAHDLEGDQQALTQIRHDLLYASADREGSKLELGTVPLSSTARRWVELESRNFLADNDDAAGDLRELTVRAAYHARERTSTLSPSASRAIVAGFVGKVEELGRKAPRKTAAVATTTFEDFSDSLLY